MSHHIHNEHHDEHHHSHAERPSIMQLLLTVVPSACIMILATYIIPFYKWFDAYANIAEALCYIMAIAIAGYNVIREAFEGLLKKDPFNECMLMTIAAIGACCIGAFHEAYFVMILYCIGEYLQSVAVYRSRHAIDKLIALVPKAVTVEQNDKLIEKHPDDIEVGDIVLAAPGERIPVDGVIIAGEASFNTAALTGESLPKDMAQGDMVYGGYIPMDRPVRIKVTEEYEHSTIARIQELIEGAEAKQAKSERFITKFSRIYTPTVVGIAVLIAVISGIATNFSNPVDWTVGWNNGLYTAITFLVASCPCALVLSIPLAFFAGLGGASKHDVLIKGAEYIETLSKVNVCAFDKTGTITTGRLHVTEVSTHLGSGATDRDIIDIAANAEKYSTHPIAEAITAMEHRDITVDEVEEFPGRGIICTMEGHRYAVGNAKLMRQYDIEVPLSEGTVIYVAEYRKPLGQIILSDTVKEDAAKMIADLKTLGVQKTVMISGDTQIAADTIAAAAGIDTVYAEKEPDEKVRVIEDVMKTGVTLYAGDGLNDAAVLTRADVGVAMGGIGSDVAVDAADVILMHDDLSKIPLVIRIARKTMRIVKQNITVAIAAKVIVLTLSLLGFSNMMWLAVLADTGIALLCAANSLRAMTVRNP